ncbi:hypothetical protein KU6B_57240 (plasmid) [Mameliella alba]|nr:hypothetical protein KU6B_57240 [Mameliella alba]
MRNPVAGQEVSCRLNGDWTYAREVGHCAMDDGRVLDAILVGQGDCGLCAGLDLQNGYVDER